jgi:paraquat-inducible protein B
MENQKKDNKLTLVNRAFALPDSEKEFGMKIADHKLICNVLDDHLDSIMGKVDEKILKTLQSDELANKVAEKVRADVAETYIQLAASLKGIETSIASIDKRLEEDEKKIETEVERLDLRANANRDAVKELRDDYEVYKEHLEYVATVKPTLETIQKVFKFWTWKENWKKIIGLILVTLIVIFALFWLFLSIKAEIDSAQAEILKYNIKPVSITYNKNK